MMFTCTVVVYLLTVGLISRSPPLPPPPPLQNEFGKTAQLPLMESERGSIQSSYNGAQAT